MLTRTSGLLAACLVLAALVSAGCFSAHSTRTYSGEMVSKDALKEVQVGSTTKGRLTTVLGKATDVKTISGNAELLKYEGVEEVQNTSRTAFVGCARETIRRRVTHYFQIDSGVVTKHWKDSVCLHKESKIESP